ncbi:MAG: hypothetical protein LBJ11_05680 [Oscillospiraceae bacterium]|jgi:stage III sporulation protein AG|nr:hypothetical protein [Oscillospiraceae bacterium]
MKQAITEEPKGLAALLQKWKLSRWQALVLAAGLVGLVLLCVTSLPGGKTGTKKNASGSAGESIQLDLSDYEAGIEQRLTELIGAIAGAGRTKVMLTMDCGNEPIYATQGKTDQSSGADGSQRLTAEQQYVIVGSGSSAQGLVLKMLEPKVRGVAILCEGANDLTVRQNITDAVTSVLGVGSNKVSVALISAYE